MKLKLALLALAISLLWNSGAVIYASELFQSFTPIQNLRVSNEAQFNGPADFNSTATFDGASTFNGATTLGSDLTAESGLTVSSGGLTVSAGLTTLSGGLNHTPQEDVVTATFVITPASGIILLTSTAEFTSNTSTPIITSTATHGDVIMIANDNASDALHIDGTGGTVECGANLDLAANENKWLWYNGNDAKWYCTPMDS